MSTEPLIPDEENGMTPGSRNVTAEDLEYLFEIDHRDAHDDSSLSCKRVQEWGMKEGLLRVLDTKEHDGIVSEGPSYQKRVQKYGLNARKEIQTKGVCEMITEQFEDPILQVLLVAAFVSLSVGVW